MWGEHVPRTLGLGDLYVWGNNTVTHLVLLERRGEAFSRSWTKPCTAIQAGVLPLPHDLEQLWDKWAQLWAVLPKTKLSAHRLPLLYRVCRAGVQGAADKCSNSKSPDGGWLSYVRREEELIWLHSSSPAPALFP